MDVIDAVQRLVSVQVDSLGRSEVEAVLRDVRVVHGFVESVRLRAVARLEAIADSSGNADSAASAAAATRTSRRQAERTRKRAKAAAAAPPVGEALAEGEISPEHLDALAAALARLEPAERSQLLTDLVRITETARATTADEFAAWLAARINALGRSDRLGEFERQRRNTTLRWWRDPDTGMIRMFGEFDPERGLALTQRLRSVVDAMFRDATPDDCPTDPVRRQDHLRALALLRLVLGDDRRAGSTFGPDHRPASAHQPQPASPPNGPSPSSPSSPSGTVPPSTAASPRAGEQAAPPGQATSVDMIIVIDLETLLNGLHEHSRVELPLDADLPIETLRRMACSAGIIPAVLGGNGVVLDVGRRQRLATADQRRALRAMYRTCGLDPGCRVPFDHCEPHHINFWTRDLGPTNIDNLVPACTHHHHKVHEGGWRLSMRASDRRLTITFPDGSVVCCWPDSRPADTGRRPEERQGRPAA